MDWITTAEGWAALVTLTVLRGSAKQEVQVKLGTLPQQP